MIDAIGLREHNQRRLIASSRNAFLLLLVLGLVFIWAPQLRTFALSLTAVAVAIVVATQELIPCLSGAVLAHIKAEQEKAPSPVHVPPSSAKTGYRKTGRRSPGRPSRLELRAREKAAARALPR